MHLQWSFISFLVVTDAFYIFGCPHIYSFSGCYFDCIVVFSIYNQHFCEHADTDGIVRIFCIAFYSYMVAQWNVIACDCCVSGVSVFLVNGEGSHTCTGIQCVFQSTLCAYIQSYVIVLRIKVGIEIRVNAIQSEIETQL